MAIKRWERCGDFDDLFYRLMPATLSRFSRLEPGMKVDWSPCADISESETEYLIRAALSRIARVAAAQAPRRSARRACR